ncbi:MAG: hypothetical protein ABSH47_14515 [Bryobacteraceae bacterium]|jgi:hypothetical protein
MSWARTLLAVLVALPVSILAVRAISLELPDFFNPCVGWGGASPESSCVQHTSLSETKMQAAVRTAAFPGVIVLAAVLGIWGVARSHRKMTLIGACLMLLEAPLLAMTIWPVPLLVLAGGGFLWLAQPAAAAQLRRSTIMPGS